MVPLVGGSRGRARVRRLGCGRQPCPRTADGTCSFDPTRSKVARTKRKAATTAKPRTPLAIFELRSSPIQGTGAFATTIIPRGTRIVEYTGERVSHAEGDRRYDGKESKGPVLLFTVDKRTVIDAGVNGNEARFVNHSCDPNCEANIERGHVYLDALRDISPGEELAYDYALTRDGFEDQASEAIFRCRCGAKSCRGSMLEPLRVVPRPSKKRKR